MQDFLQQLGNVTAVIGAQWGDEGKGKAIDLLTEHFDVVARACGGANAGHTIVVDGTKHVFRLLPSGCLHDHVQIVLGTGMVLHLPTLIEEIELLRAAGIDILPRLHIAANAHILFEYHKDIDAKLEERRAAKTGGEIGTTKRGIGPAYTEKAARTGIRMEQLSTDLRMLLEQKATDIKDQYGIAVDVSAECAALESARSFLRDHIVDTATLLHAWHNDGKRILIEGAQATLLDIDHGTYPYVTSSATTAAGALQGLGMPPQALHSVIGVAKAYCTRVGSGDFLTEVHDATANRLRERGGEYGSVTKRPRRCGWLHLPDLRRAASINGIACWNITKLDVLDEEETIPVGIGDNGTTVEYRTLEGWRTSTAGISRYEDLPAQARSLIDLIEEQTDIPVRIIGTGQERSAMIVR